MACGPGGLPPVPTISAAGAALGGSFRRIIHARGAVLWACRPPRVRLPRCSGLPSAACPARFARSRAPLPLVFGVLQVIFKAPGGAQRSDSPTRVSTKPRPASSSRPLRVRETSQLIRRQTVVYQRIALFDKRCCNDSLRNTHVNKKTLSDSLSCCLTRPWPVALEQRSS